MRGKPSPHNDDRRILNILNVTKQIVRRQRHIERGTTVRKLLQQSLWLWPSVIVIRWVELLYTIFRWICHVSAYVVVRIWVRSRYEDGT